MNTTISYTRKLALWKKIVGVLIMAFGLYNFFFTAFSLVPILLGLLLLRTNGCEIDLSSRSYRSTHSVLGLKVGRWQPLPETEYISVFATKEKVTARALSAETTHSEDIIALNLFYDRNKKIKVYQTNSLEDAFEVAFHIADALMIDVLDATRKNDYRWVDTEAYRSDKQIVYSS